MYVALSNKQEPDLMYKTREEQVNLLQQVLSASDTDADEERIPGEGPRLVIIYRFIFGII